MSLLYMDGFDYMPAAGTRVSSTILTAMNYFNLGPYLVITTPGPYGGLALMVDNYFNGGNGGQAYLVVPSFLPSITDETIIGQRMRFDSSARGNFVVSNTSVGIQWGIRVSLYGEVLLMAPNMSTVLAISPPNTVNTNAWNYFDFRFQYDATNNGRMRIRVNTDLMIDYTGPLGTGGVGSWNSLGWYNTGTSGNSGSGNYMAWDDLYVLTTTGSNDNDYLGNVRVRLQQPSAPGDITGLVPTGAPTNWQAQINPSLDPGIYDSTATVGNYDLYKLQANAGSRNIYGIQTRGCYFQDNATQLKGGTIIKTGGTEYDSSEHSLSSTYDTYYDIWEINPQTSLPWTAADLNALQSGPKLLASA